MASRATSIVCGSSLVCTVRTVVAVSVARVVDHRISSVADSSSAAVMFINTTLIATSTTIHSVAIINAAGVCRVTTIGLAARVGIRRDSRSGVNRRHAAFSHTADELGCWELGNGLRQGHTQCAWELTRVSKLWAQTLRPNLQTSEKVVRGRACSDRHCSV